MKRKESAIIEGQTQLASDIFSMWLRVSFAGEVKAGQFLSLFTGEASKPLPRPVSVCETDPEAGRVRLVYRVVGSGTALFASMKAGDRIAVMGPLGNGFPLERTAGKRVLLIGGGLGIPPMLACASVMSRLSDDRKPLSAAIAAGYRDSNLWLLDDMRKYAPVMIATDDGSAGTRGTVLDSVRASGPEADVIFSCGPKVMLRAVKQYAEETGAECYVSMEERMACGIGVCLGCVCGTTKTDSHSLVKNARVCTDGPVFPAEEVDLT